MTALNDAPNRIQRVHTLPHIEPEEGSSGHERQQTNGGYAFNLKKEGIISMEELKEGMKEKEMGLEHMAKQFEAVSNRNRMLEEQNRRHLIEIERLQDELLRAEVRHTQTLELLNSRTIELQGARKFLTKADSISGAEVIEKVESLNSEILQVAAVMAESLGFGQGYGKVDVERVNDAYRRASRVLGDKMVQLLRSRKRRGDLMLIQSALQGCIAWCCGEIIKAWYFEDRHGERFLAEIYALIQRVEEQTVAGRWRALTRAQVSRCSSQRLMEYLVCVLVDVLIAAGWGVRELEAADTVMAKFGERLSVVIKLAVQLNKTIGEEVTSGDLKTIVVDPEVDFDPMKMDNAYADDEPSSEKTSGIEQVLCTSDLGLRRVVKGSREGRYQREEVLILKPKVILLSALEDETSVGGSSG